MAVHRSPGGWRARPQSARRPGARPHVVSPVLRTSVLASAATLGAVTTGTFAALVPTAGTAAPISTSGPIVATLSANSAPLELPAGPGSGRGLVPVATALSAEDQAGADDDTFALLDKAAGIAARIAELHAQEQRAQVDRARSDALITKGGLDGWIAEALRIVDLPQSLAPSVKKIIMAESGGNPRAINKWDSNAQRGTPSQGLMQTIPSTFRKFVHPELAHRSITDPIANITAGLRYMIATYGMDTLENGGRRSASGTYVGY
ncbi:MAG: transglycosylase SLT domain-containing protein [Pseudonocardia sp.]